MWITHSVARSSPRRKCSSFSPGDRLSGITHRPVARAVAWSSNQSGTSRVTVAPGGAAPEIWIDEPWTVSPSAIESIVKAATVLGTAVGSTVGSAVSWTVDWTVGGAVGSWVGGAVGRSMGGPVGSSVATGGSVGRSVDGSVGSSVPAGWRVGSADGRGDLVGDAKPATAVATGVEVGREATVPESSRGDSSHASATIPMTMSAMTGTQSSPDEARPWGRRAFRGPIPVTTPVRRLVLPDPCRVIRIGA